MSALSTAQPLPPAAPLPKVYPRHDPGVDEQRAETRSVAADAVRRIIAEARLTTGPAGLALDQDISHAIPNLELYVSQHNVDADATVLGDPARRPG
jgi:hypothetical protein